MAARVPAEMWSMELDDGRRRRAVGSNFCARRVIRWTWCTD